MFERYDDEHLELFFCRWAQRGYGEDNRRTARICAVVTNAMRDYLRFKGAKRKDGGEIEDATEDDFIPTLEKQKRVRRKVRQQKWSEIRSVFGSMMGFQ